ncbi:MAG: hypothetical protein AAF500_01930 [Myxococcota bacterium]
MPSLRLTPLLVLCLSAAICIASCTDSSASTTAQTSGALSVDIHLRGEIQINQVTWEITREGMVPMDGTIDTTAPDATPSVEVFGLEPGDGYLITMVATSPLGETRCGGSAEFSVEAGVTTDVTVLLNCEPPVVLGGVRVNGEFNVCAGLTLVVVSPLQTSVGSNIDLLADAVDHEGDDISYLWEATGGTIDDPSAPETFYTCDAIGNYDITIQVSDDNFDYCVSGWTVRVTCVEGDGGGPECQGDADCDDDEVCVDGHCVADVECRFNADCDSGEICVNAVCVPDVECRFDADCGPDEICVDTVCVPDVECRFNLDCEAGEVCVNATCVPDAECSVAEDCEVGEICVNSFCIPDVECDSDADCDFGEICVRNACMPDVECNFDQDCDDGEICVNNTCAPDVECNVDQDCGESNECRTATCNGTGLCEVELASDGTPCDGGDGVCTAGVCRVSDLFGTDFVIVFGSNYLPPQTSLFLSGPQSTVGLVTIPSIGYSESFAVTPGNVTMVTLPAGTEINATDGIEAEAAVRVSSVQPITVYGFNRVLRGTDAFAALPTVALGDRYRVVAWPGGINGPSQLTIAATPAFEGDTTTTTTVTITPSAAAGSRPAGVPFDVVLNPFDAYQLQSTGDLTGSLVQADRPIAVHGGNRCANIPTQATGFCDHVVEQILPVSTWGTEVVTVPLATRTEGDTFRILADQNGTQVQLEGASPESINLNAGDFVERNLIGSYRISASAPILVTQFSNGSQFDNSTSDPFMMLIPSASQFIKSYTFATPASGFPTNFANVVALTTDVTSNVVRLDGTPLSPSVFTALPGTNFSAAQVPISVGTHTLSAPNPLGLYVYGYDSFDSYGYPGGFTARNP